MNYFFNFEKITKINKNEIVFLPFVYFFEVFPYMFIEKFKKIKNDNVNVLPD